MLLVINNYAEQFYMNKGSKIASTQVVDNLTEV